MFDCRNSLISNSRKLIPAILLAMICMSITSFASAQVTLSATSLTFPSTTVGTWSASQHVTMTNTGTAALSITSISVTGTNASSFMFANNCGTSLAVGANCLIQGHFQPTANGPLTAAITISDSASGSPQSIALSGTGLGPVVSLSATSLSFGSSAVGTATASQSVTLTNTGQAALSITSIKATGANASSFASTNTCGSSVAVGANCSISVDFDPVTGGALTASITITDNAGGSPQSIALSGTGLGPAATLSSTSLTFPSTTVGTWSASQSLTMTNTGTAALSITSISVTGTNASSFMFANNCGTSLAVGANCTIHGHFQPTANGPVTATITIVDNAGNSPQSIALSGTGLGPVVSLSATSLSFGSSAVGTATASQSVTLTNSGAAALAITSISVTGANASSFPFTNTCGTSVAAGANCTISGDFNPATGGALTAAVTITDNATGSPQKIALTGTGLGPAATPSVASLTFPSTTVGTWSASQSFTLTNTGNAALTITSIAVTGTNASSFMFANNCGTSLAVGANCTIHGHFQPTANGPVTATITIVDNAGNSPQTIALSGTGLGPVVSLSATSLSFGSSAVGTATASQSVTLTNSGAAALAITSISVTGASASSFPFTNTCGTSVAAGANCTISGDFDPATGGALTAAVTITDNATGSPQKIALTGTGLGPAATLSVTSLTFPSTTVGAWSASQSFTMTNTGNAALTITSIAVTGTNASSYMFANNCGTSLAVGANCTIHGHFQPTANGPLPAAITFTDNAGGSPQSVALSGTGLGPAVSLSATSLSFGSSAVGTATASQSVTLTNTGQAALSITSIAVTGANASSFVFTNTCGTSVAAGANCTISGDFDPTTGGPLTAVVTITDNATGSPQMITLTGTGLGPAASLSSTSLTYPSTTVGTWSASQHVTMTNTGSSALSITSIAVTGTNASSFAFANNCGTSLAAGANCLIQGHFQPTVSGPLAATITIVDNAGNSPQTIALSGTGISALTLPAGGALPPAVVGESYNNSAVAGDATYTYKGNGFNQFTGSGPYTSANSISGHFTTSSNLPANLNQAEITSEVTNYSFTDGSVNTITPSNGSGPRFVVSTNAQAALTAWDVTLITGNPPTNGGLFTCNGITAFFNSCPSAPYDWSYEDNGAIDGQIDSNPGSWTSSLSPTSSVQINASGGSGSGYVFTVNGTAIPATGTAVAIADGITVSSTGGTALTIGGTPTAPQVVTLIVSVKDGAGDSAGPQTYTITVTSPSPLVLQASTLPSATTNVAYSGAINASGGSGSGYVFTVNGTAIPTTGATIAISDGISVSSTGGLTLSVSGTPTSAGTVTLTNVTVKDSLGDTAGPVTYTIAVTSPGYAVTGQIGLLNSCGTNGTLPIFTVSINTSPVQTTTTNSSGQYTFANIPNGTYTITPSITGPSSVFYPATETGVVVNNGPATVPLFNAALGYTVSGTVSYSGTKTGRAYVKLSCGTAQGTSIAAPGPFTIRGVWPGYYTLSAWTDNLGYGVPNASNPTGSTSQFVLSNANVSGIAVTLNDPGTVSLSAGPVLNVASGFEGGAFVMFNAIKSNGVELPTSYTVQWSTSQSFSSITGSQTFAAEGDNPWLVSGIADGSGYYFRAQGVAGSSVSAWSNVLGPITVGAPTAANTLSGSITFNQTATGPLYVGVYDQNTRNIYATVVGSKVAPPTSPASYSVQVPTGSQYFFFALLDQNNDGLIDTGDVGNVNSYNMITPTLAINGNTTKNFTLASGNSTAVVRTDNYYDISEWGNGGGYSLNFDVTGVTRQPVAVALISGPNIITPQDIALCRGCGYDTNSSFSFVLEQTSTVPTVGATYGVQVTYSDGTTETLNPKITAVIPNPATNLSPQGPVSADNLTPTLTWTYPANAGNYLYQMWFADENYETIWSIPSLNSNTNSFTSSIAPSITWGTDPTGATGNTPSPSTLQTGEVAHWELVAYDANGNRASEFVDYVPGFTALALPPGNPGTLGPAYLGQSYSGSISATGGYGGYAYAINGIYNCYGCVGISLGNGLYVTNAQGTLNIAGVPTATGTVSFQVWVVDQSSASYQNPVGPITYTITITHEAVSLPPASSNPLGTLLSGIPHSGAINASGGVGGGNYTFTVNGVSIPTTMTYVSVTGADGLTFANSGGNTLWAVGTPTSAGTFPIDVTVTDTTESGNSASVTYSMVVGSGPNGANNGYLKGTYVCKFDGYNDSDGSRWSSLSSFNADGTDTSGNGTLTGGVWNMSTHSINTASTAMSGTLTGTYSIGADNNGLMTLNSVETSPSTGTHSGVYAIALNDVNLATTTATEFRMVEADDLGANPSGMHGSGLCYQATTSAFAPGTVSGSSFVHGIQGEDESGLPEAMVGRLAFSTESATGGTGGAAGGTITSYVDDDFYIKKTTNQGSSCTSSCGTYTAPDANGRVTTSIPVVVQGIQATLQYVVYIIDANRAFILTTSGDGGVQSGEVRKQQETSYSNANLDGSAVIYAQGFEYSGSSVSGYDSLVLQGTATGAGGITPQQYYQDANGTFKNGGSAVGSLLPVTFDPSNPGRATASPGSDSMFLYFFDTNSAFELDWNGGGSPSYLETGWMDSQTQTTFTNAALAGNYLFGQLPVMQAFQGDAIGELSVLSNGTITGGLTEADEGYFIWDRAPSWTYTPYTTGSGGFLVTGTGDTGGDSCIVISATKLACTSNADSSPSVGVLQQ